MFDIELAIRTLQKTPDVANQVEVEAFYANCRRIRTFVDSREAETTARVVALKNKSNPGTKPAADDDNAKRKAADDIAESTGCTGAEAKKKANTAAHLSEMPLTAFALQNGQITGAHADELAKLRNSLGPELRKEFDFQEDELVEMAKCQRVHELRRSLADWKLANQPEDDGNREAEKRHNRRNLSLWKGADGMGHIRGELGDEDFEAVSRAIGDIAGELFHGSKDDDTPVAGPQRNADALVELARRAVGATADQRGKAKPTVIVTISEDSLLGRLNEAGVLGNGETVPAETARRLACEANIIPLVLGGEGEALDVGRDKRLATKAQRIALRNAYPTCGVDWCDMKFDWCEIHHIKPWEDHGPTDLDNLVPLCSNHHHLVHEGGFSLTTDAAGKHKFFKDRSTNPANAGPSSRAQQETLL